MSASADEIPVIDPSVGPSGPGCVECTANRGWWVHLRRCAACGHVGCCDTSPAQHATHHYEQTGHPIMQSYEPGEEWFYDFRTGESIRGPELAEPTSRPDDQGAPGPVDRLPDNWEELINN